MYTYYIFGSLNATPICKCSFIRTSISNDERGRHFISRKYLVDRKLILIIYFSDMWSKVIYWNLYFSFVFRSISSSVIFGGMHCFIPRHVLKCYVPELVCSSVIFGVMYCLIPRHVLKCYIPEIVCPSIIFGVMHCFIRGNVLVLCSGACVLQCYNLGSCTVLYRGIYSSVMFRSLYAPVLYLRSCTVLYVGMYLCYVSELLLRCHIWGFHNGQVLSIDCAPVLYFGVCTGATCMFQSLCSIVIFSEYVLKCYASKLVLLCHI